MDPVKTFEQVYKNYYTWLFHQALDMTLDPELARDFVEDVYVIVWQRFDTISLEKMQGLLRTLMRNRVVNYFRHRQVEMKYELDMRANATGFYSDDDDTYEERLRQVTAIIDAQPPQRRFIFEQCCLRNKSYREVAALLGLEVSTIHKNVSRVYAELREKVKIQSYNC